jgi:hypothetical protein
VIGALRYFAERLFASRYWPKAGVDVEPAEQVLAARFALFGMNPAHTIDVSFEDRRVRSLNQALEIEASFEDRRVRSGNPTLSLVLALD